jgi:hypothetical protein
MIDSSRSSVAKHSPCDAKVKGSNPVAFIGTGRAKMVKILKKIVSGNCWNVVPEELGLFQPLSWWQASAHQHH